MLALPGFVNELIFPNRNAQDCSAGACGCSCLLGSSGMCQEGPGAHCNKPQPSSLGLGTNAPSEAKIPPAKLDVLYSTAKPRTNLLEKQKSNMVLYFGAFYYNF